MTVETIEFWRPALAEIFLAAAAMALLMFGVFRGDGSTRLVGWLSIWALVVAFGFALGVAGDVTFAFRDLFIVDPFAGVMKCLVILGAAASIGLAVPHLEREGMARPEFPVLVLFATLGMMMMVSANDLLALYVGLELQSLSLYVLAAYARDNVRSSEAGLKYFVLGSLASGLLLYGASLVYGFAGSTDFQVLARALQHDGPAELGIVVGMVFLLAGLAFKISAVPFHMWTPDVYEGAPTPVTALFAIAPKVAAMALLTRLLVGPFQHLLFEWQQVLWLIALLSMLWGSFGAIGQNNIKRLMAYSSIGHVGFALVGVTAAVGRTDAGGFVLLAEGVRAVVVYMAIYVAMSAGTFAVILMMRREGRMLEDMRELAGLSRQNPGAAFAMAAFMFSMAGIPPLAGFFSKFYVFMAAIDAGLYSLAVLGVLSSVVGCFYYLRIVKLMYFDEPGQPFDRQVPHEHNLVMTVSAVVVVFFFLFAAPVVSVANGAAAALVPG